MYSGAGGDTVSKRYTVDNLAVGDVPHSTTELHSVTIASGPLPAGADVLVTPRDPTGLPNGCAVYGVVIDATHVGIAIVNATGGTLSVGTPDFNVRVFQPTGALSQAV